MQLVRRLTGVVKAAVVWGAIFAIAGLAMAGGVNYLAADTGGADTEPTAASATGADPATAAARIADRVATDRASAGVGALDRDADLQAAARTHARDMHARDFYAHENPDGEQPWDRAECRATETIHRGVVAPELRGFGTGDTFDTTTADGLAAYTVAGWQNSADHAEIMRDAGHDRIGVGVAIEDGEFFAVAMFC